MYPRTDVVLEEIVSEYNSQSGCVSFLYRMHITDRLNLRTTPLVVCPKCLHVVAARDCFTVSKLECQICEKYSGLKQSLGYEKNTSLICQYEERVASHQ